MDTDSMEKSIQILKGSIPEEAEGESIMGVLEESRQMDINGIIIDMSRKSKANHASRIVLKKEALLIVGGGLGAVLENSETPTE